MNDSDRNIEVFAQSIPDIHNWLHGVADEFEALDATVFTNYEVSELLRSQAKHLLKQVRNQDPHPPRRWRR